MAMLSVRRKHSYVSVRLSRITKMCNIPLRWFSPCAGRTGYLRRAAWKASLSFVLRDCTYGSHCVKLFSQYLRWLKLCFRCTNVFPGLILPEVINGERAVPFWFGLKPWHRYQPSLHPAWISCSLNSFELRLSKSHTCVYSSGMISARCSVPRCFATWRRYKYTL